MKEMDQLKKTVAQLRAPDGCPWDKEQTHKSLTGCLVEECSEVLDTIDRDDKEHMREELGDLLLQVLMHSQIAEEEGHFRFEEVTKEINEKLIRRHPHVFGDLKGVEDSNDVLKKWDEIKKAEKQAKGKVEDKLFKDLPPSLPSLLFARDVFKQIQKKSINASTDIEESLIEKNAKDLTEEKLGEVLFQWVASARFAEIDPEAALRRYTNKLVSKLEEKYS